MTTFDVRARPVTSSRRREGRRSVALLAAAAFAAVGILSYRLVSRTDSTDDARVEHRTTTVPARLGGRIRALHVRDNQVVEPGQVLLEIESDELTTQLQLLEAERDGASATLRSARAQVTLTERAARASLTQARGGVLQAGHGLRALNAATEQAEHELRIARAHRQRLERELHAPTSGVSASPAQLAAQGALPLASPRPEQAAHELEAVRANEARAEAQLVRMMADRSTSWGGIVAARGRLEEASSISEQLELARANVAQAEANLAQAEARLKLAQRGTAAGIIRAPARGTVTQLRTALGRTVSLDAPLLDIEANDDSWITANFQEDQLDQVRPGQPAKVTIDAISERAFKAHVDSFVGDTKVKLRFDEQVEARALKAGMRAAVSVMVKD